MASYTTVSRAEWNARPPERTVPLNWGKVTMFIVHYSGASRSQSVRSIQDFCMDSKGHSDIDYNDLVRDGIKYIGRGVNEGSHTLNHNAISYGVCIIGNEGDANDADFATVRQIYDEVCANLGRQLQKLGHRDVLGTSYTSCPGDEIEAWIHAGMPYPNGVDDVNQADVEAIWGSYLARNGMNLVDNLGNATANSVHIINQLNEVKALLANGGTGDGLTDAQVRAIVREELDKTKLAS